jgi:WD40 repeat protein
VNQHGLLLAGCEKGDLQVYKLKAEDIQRKSPNCFTYVDTYNIHKKEVHFVSYSPDPHGPFVMTGSRDGTCQIF